MTTSEAVGMTSRAMRPRLSIHISTGIAPDEFMTVSMYSRSSSVFSLSSETRRGVTCRTVTFVSPDGGTYTGSRSPAPSDGSLTASDS